MVEPVEKRSVHTLVFRSLKRTHDMFISDRTNPIPNDENAQKIALACKVNDEYGLVKKIVEDEERKKSSMVNAVSGATADDRNQVVPASVSSSSTALAMAETRGPAQTINYTAVAGNVAASVVEIQEHAGIAERYAPPPLNKALVQIASDRVVAPLRAPTVPKPQWHPPWKLYRVISGHGGWVRCINVEPGNEWFVTGAADRIIKIWDLATGNLKLSLTGHVSAVRGVVVSARHPYLFSCSEDKQVKCWDLEQNKVVRHYHGHLSAVYALALHPTIDILFSCGRDATVRLWDMRTRACVHTLTGHTNTVASVVSSSVDPQCLSGSHDSTIRLWDIVAGRSSSTLTHHKKSVRALAMHPTQSMFASASPDNIKQWHLPEGNFMQNLSGHNAIVNCLAVNSDNVLVSGADNGTLYFWDWRTGYNFQRHQAPPQPGSIDSENGIYALAFDHSGSRLLTAEADKTIKMYKEDDQATEESHPITWRPDIYKKKKY